MELGPGRALGAQMTRACSTERKKRTNLNTRSIGQAENAGGSRAGLVFQHLDKIRNLDELLRGKLPFGDNQAVQ